MTLLKNIDTKSHLAKLLATENIQVEQNSAGVEQKEGCETFCRIENDAEHCGSPPEDRPKSSAF